MRWPEAEVDIDEALVRSLLRAQFPALAAHDCYEVAHGFDNSLWRLGGSLVVRLPRRAVAVVTVENELRWLAVMAEQVPLRTPLPVLAGAPDVDYPWPWSISSWIEGVPGDESAFEPSIGSARSLASFLRAIHVDAPPDAPRNPYRGVELAARHETFEERLNLVGDQKVIDVRVLRPIWEAARAAPTWDGPAQWIHGDFHPGNHIYRDRELVGIIDFGDLGAGDPSTDLAGALLSLPASLLETFFESYGSVDRSCRMRTLGWALLFGLMMLSLGLESRPRYRPIGERAIANVVALFNDA